MTEAAARQRIGHYVVEGTLGHGAMGTVYLARDERIGRRVALKQLQLAKAQFEDAESAAEFYMRLQREAEVCGSLQHPNIVTLYDVGYDGERISYLALEYVAGETLLDLLKRHRPRPLPVEAALRIAADILRGLAYAHAKGIVHRDVKPANILIGDDGVAKIADFGIARPQQSSMTVAGALMGTPNYMPPEQVKGIPATPRSDLFSLGVLLFEMVAGAKPFIATELAALLEKIVRTPTPSAAAVNPRGVRAEARGAAHRGRVVRRRQLRREPERVRGVSRALSVQHGRARRRGARPHRAGEREARGECRRLAPDAEAKESDADAGHQAKREAAVRREVRPDGFTAARGAARP